MSEEDLGLKFDILDASNLVSHWILQSKDVARLVADTPEYKANSTLVARVTVNGVELPFEALEGYLRDAYSLMERRIRDEYADAEALVQKRLNERLEIEVDPVIEKLNDLSQALTGYQDFFKPHWEK